MGLVNKLLDVQRECPTLGFDASNPHFKNNYVTLGKVLETVLPLLQEKGILLQTPLGALPTGPAVIIRFTDTETGEVAEDAVPLILEKITPQAMGSAITYTRRYGILAALNLVGEEDDDAEGASVHPIGKPKTPKF